MKSCVVGGRFQAGWGGQVCSRVAGVGAGEPSRKLQGSISSISISIGATGLLQLLRGLLHREVVDVLLLRKEGLEAAPPP